jgi:magnesium transporter
MPIAVYVYEPTSGVSCKQEADSQTVRVALAAPDSVIWIAAFGHDEETERVLRDVLELHPLTVEDVIADLPHPKIEEFVRYLYIIVHGIDQAGGTPDALQTTELDIVLGERFIFTHQTRPMRSVDAVRAEIARGCHLFEKGAAWIVHALLDHLTDHYLPLMDAFDLEIDRIETRAVTDPSRSTLQGIFALKHSLMDLRRVASHQREILLRLSRAEFALIPAPVVPFFRDVYDHFTRVSDLCDSYRELVSGALEAYLSTTSNRMNEIMKVLTAIATIMMPLTFVAGVYGMNFEHMPELKWRYGYAYAWGLMAAITATMLVYFRRRRWF